MSQAFLAVEGFVSVDLEWPVFDEDGNFLGSVSMLLKPEVFFDDYTLSKLNNSLEIMVMQPDQYILYDTDKTQIGRSITDPIYQEYTSLISLSGKVAASKSGTGSYEFLDAAGQQTLAKKCVWATAGLHGTEWRLIINQAVETI